MRIPHRPDLPGHARIEVATPVGDGWMLFIEQAPGIFAKVELTAEQAAACEVLTQDGAGDSPALLAGLCWLDSFLEVLTGSGFSDEAAVAAYRAYTSFLLGHLLLEVSQHGVKISPLDEPEGTPDATVDYSEYPHLIRLKPLLSQDESAAEFEESLENLLDRLDRVLKESKPRRGNGASSKMTRG